MKPNSQINAIRADQIGSLLRPSELLDARTRHSAGELDDEALQAAEDEAIRAILDQQQQAGIDVVTDGEYRRSDFRAGLADALDGMVTSTSTRVWHGSEGDKEIAVKVWYVDGKLVQKSRLCAQETAFLRDNASSPYKITLVSPGFMAGRAFRKGVTDKYYPTIRDLADELATVVRREIEALIDEGVKYIQLDNPGYAFFLDPENREKLKAEGRDPDRAFEGVLATDLAAVKDIERPDDVCLALHICRGNNASYWLNEGDYGPIAERLFSELPVDRFLLEFDDARSGGFEPLRFIPDDKSVVLGLVSTKTRELEDPDVLLGRIDDAAKYVTADRLAVSPQCGFATHAEGGNALTMDDQRRKLELVAEVARRYWV